MKLVTTNKLNKFWKSGILPIKNALVGKQDKAKILNTKEEIMANTSSEYAAGALAVKELNNNLKGFEPVLDETGKITGYRTSIGGADTVFPFSGSKKTKTITIRAHVLDNRMCIYVNGALICTGSTWSEAICGYTVTVD